MAAERESSMSLGLIGNCTIILFFCLFVKWFVKRQYKVWLIDRMPGPRGLPLLGNAIELDLDSVGLFQKLNDYCDMGELMRFWVGPVAQCLISSARAAEVILSSQKHINKSYDYTFLQPWLGTGLLTSTGAKWRSRRKLLTPAFHFKILEDFMHVFNAQSQKMAIKLELKANGEPFDIFSDVALCTLDVICETAMGQSINAMDNSDSEYVQAVSRIAILMQQRMMTPWLQPDILYKILGPMDEYKSCLKILHDFTTDVIRTRRDLYRRKKELKLDMEEISEEAVVSKNSRLAFLDILLEYSDEGAHLTDEDIREEVDTFMFEGHDTTATAVNWFFHLVGTHPEIQAKIHNELDRVFGDRERHATMSDLRELKYLENCIKETLRLFPSVPIIAREVTEDVYINDYRIPAGTNVNVMVYRLHRDPEYFPYPEDFNPDRFLPENCHGRHPYAYLPFSAGPRNCIGQKFAMMEEKILISSVLRRYRVESVLRREDLKVTADLILRNQDGNIVRLFPRSD